MNFDIYKSIPVGSLVDFETTDDSKYLADFPNMPTSLINLIMSPQTGAYVRGTLKTNEVELSKTPRLAFIILRIATGEITLAKLAAVISSELQIANDKAQEMAREIEHDLIAPVAMELNQYLENRKKEKKTTDNKATGSPQAAGAKNVLDLKKQTRPPRPPQMP